MLPKYSFVVPVYNEQDNINALYESICTIANDLDGSIELLFIDDGSSDNSLNLIRQLRQIDDRIIYLSLARNFGHQLAITAGLNYVCGDAVIIMDADLQDPPELIPALIEKWQQGNQVVYAERVIRKEESKSKKLFAFIFYRLLRNIAEINIPADSGDFCLLDKKVVDILNTLPERNRYLRGLRAWVGFNQVAIRFERNGRNAGKPQYTFRKSLGLAMNALFSFSKIPLKFATYLGILSAIASIIMAFLVLYWRIFQTHSPVRGYATILIVVFFIGAIQLISVGILGEYIGRIYEEVKRRPLYTISELGGLREKSNIILPVV